MKKLLISIVVFFCVAISAMADKQIYKKDYTEPEAVWDLTEWWFQPKVEDGRLVAANMNPWDQFMLTNAFEAEEGKDYRVEIKIKGSNYGVSPIRFNFSGGNREIYLPVTTEWQTLQGIFQNIGQRNWNGYDIYLGSGGVKTLEVEYVTVYETLVPNPEEGEIIKSFYDGSGGTFGGWGGPQGGGWNPNATVDGEPCLSMTNDEWRDSWAIQSAIDFDITPNKFHFIRFEVKADYDEADYEKDKYGENRTASLKIESSYQGQHHYQNCGSCNSFELTKDWQTVTLIAYPGIAETERTDDENVPVGSPNRPIKWVGSFGNFVGTLYIKNVQIYTAPDPVVTEDPVLDDQYLIWEGPHQCGWGDAVGIDKEKLVSLAPGDVIRVQYDKNAESTLQFMPGGWSGPNIPTYEAGNTNGFLSKNEADGTFDMNFTSDQYEFHWKVSVKTGEKNEKGEDIYKDEPRVFDLYDYIKNGGLTMHGPCLVKNIYYIPSQNNDVFNESMAEIESAKEAFNKALEDATAANPSFDLTEWKNKIETALEEKKQELFSSIDRAIITGATLSHISCADIEAMIDEMKEEVDSDKRTPLTAKINKAKLYDSFAKTAESFAALQSAIASAETAVNSENATKESLEAAGQAIEDAIAGLVIDEGYEYLTSEMFKHHESYEEPGVGTNAGCAYELLTSTNNPYGDGTSANLNWADLSEYDKLYVTISGNDKPRVWINRSEDNGQDGSSKEDSKMLDMQAGNGKWSTNEYTTFDNEKNLFTVDLNKIKADYTFARLHAIKYGWGVNGIVTGMYLYKADDPLEIPKEALKKKIEDAKQCDDFLKSKATWDILQDAIANAEAALTAENATVESLEAAGKAVDEAIAGLELQPGYSELTKDMFKKYASVDNPGEGEATGCDYNLNVESGSPYGDCNSVGYLNWADLTGYDKLIIKATSGTQRFCMNRLSDGGQQKDTMEESLMLDITVGSDSWSAKKYLKSDGNVHTVDLSQIVDDYGFARLHTIKYPWGQNGIVTGMYLYKDPEAPSEFNLTFNIDDPEHVVIKVDDEVVTDLEAGDNEKKVADRAKLSIAPAENYILKSVTANEEEVVLKDGMLTKTVVKPFDFTITTDDADPLAKPKKELSNIIEKAGYYDSFAKTETSFKALTDAIASAEKALEAEDASEESLKTAGDNINKAIEGLKLEEGYSYLTPEMFKKYASVAEPGEGEATECKHELFNTSRLLYGEVNNDRLKWADLTGYGNLILTTVGKGDLPRFCFNNLEATGDQAASMIEINPYDANNSTDTEKYQTVNEDKTIFNVDLKKLAKDHKFAHLHSIQVNGWGTGAFVNGMYLYKVDVKEVTLDKAEAAIVKGESLTLKATVTPDDASDDTVTWSSSDEKVASVDETGKVTAVDGGEAVITAKAGDKTATCKVTVTVPVASIVILDADNKPFENEAAIALNAGDTYVLTAQVDPENATNKTVTWSSSDEKVATVDETGKVTAVDGGEAVITAKAGDKTATCKVTVTVPVASIVILDADNKPFENEAAIALNAGDTYVLTAQVDPENATNKTVTWSSSNAKVATVDETGKVTAVDGGEAVITAKAGDKTATCKVTVTVPVTGLVILDEDLKPLESGAVIALETGDTYDLTAQVDPKNATDNKVIWTSSDVEIAEVDNQGLIQTHQAGEATITAKIAEFTFTAKVTVTDPVVPVEKVTLDKTTAEMLPGETLQLKATIEPDDASSKEVGWSSSDKTIATVTKGLVTALKPGKVTITATANKKTATCEITIKEIEVAEISLDKTEATIVKGETLELVATVKPENATDPTVTWTSSNVKVATVDENGIVTAVDGGSAVITAKAGDKTATCKVTVTVPVAGLVILDEDENPLKDGDLIEFHTNHEYNLTAVVSPENATDQKVTWTTSDETIIKFMDDEGLMDGLKAGEATVTASIAGFSVTIKVKVTDPVIEVTGVTLDKTTADMITGSTLQLTATLSPADATSKDVTWTTSDKSVATVSTKGLVKALKAGTVTITATSNKISATCVITVKDIEVIDITLDKTEAHIYVGETLTLNATVTPEDATDPTVIWSSSNESVATVDENGVVTGHAIGSALITATAGDKSADCFVVVDKSSGIEGLGFDREAPMQVFDLRGVFISDKVDNLVPGIYIVRQGNNQKKVVIK